MATDNLACPMTEVDSSNVLTSGFDVALGMFEPDSPACEAVCETILKVG